MAIFINKETKLAGKHVCHFPPIKKQTYDNEARTVSQLFVSQWGILIAVLEILTAHDGLIEDERLRQKFGITCPKIIVVI